MGISLVSEDVNSKSIFQVIFHQCSVFYEQREASEKVIFIECAFSEEENEKFLGFKAARLTSLLVWLRFAPDKCCK